MLNPCVNEVFRQMTGTVRVLGEKENGNNTLTVLFPFLWPRQESNLDLELRKLLYYPLYYEANSNTD